jgi:hypothetical protein
MAYPFATNVTRLAISLATAEQEACNISHKGPNIIRISVLTCTISPLEYPSTIHMFILPSNIKCISSTILKSVTMLPHSFLNKRVPLPIHFNHSRKTIAPYTGTIGKLTIIQFTMIQNVSKKNICMIRTILKYQIVI